MPGALSSAVFKEAVHWMAQFEINSSIRSYHVYQDNWTPVVGEQLLCKREEGNPRDRYALAIKKTRDTMGHVSHNISTVCSLFIRRGGAIFCMVTGWHRHSRDLPQGGIEIPCKYRFVGNGKEIKKVESYVTKSKAAHYLSSSMGKDTIEQSSNSEKLQSDQQSLTPRNDIGVTRAKNPSNLTTKINDNIRGLLVTASISSSKKLISDQPSIST